MNRRQKPLKFSIFKAHLSASIRKIAALALFLAASWAAPAQNPFFLTSSTDGNGLFTYTFSPGDANFVIGMATNNGGIYMPSHDVLSVSSPPGWTASVEDDIVTWTSLNDTLVYLGSPSLTFSIQSSSTESALYNVPIGSDPFSKGAVFGAVHFLDEPDQNSDGEGTLGFLTFPFMGPAEIPEPSSLGLLLLGPLMVALTRRFPSPAANR